MIFESSLARLASWPRNTTIGGLATQSKHGAALYAPSLLTQQTASFETTH